MFSFFDKLILYITCTLLIGSVIDHKLNHHKAYQKKPYVKYEKSQKTSYHTNVSKPRLRYSKEVQQMKKDYNNE